MRRTVLFMGISAVLMTAAPAAEAQTNLASGIQQAEQHLFGGLAGRWWQWVLQVPAESNPLTDATGVDCGEHQSGPIWFLAGSWVGNVERTCSVPEGRVLFFPVINDSYAAFLTDPADQRTESFLRAQVTCAKDAQGTVTIDGHPFPTVYEDSSLYSVVLPQDNVYGATSADIPDLTFSPAVDAGYYALVPWLPAGKHTIHIQGSGCGATQDVIYHLNIVRH